MAKKQIILCATSEQFIEALERADTGKMIILTAPINIGPRRAHGKKTSKE